MESNRPLRGIGWMLLATFFVAAMHASVRQVADDGLHPFEVVFFRNLFGILALFPWFLRSGMAPLRTERFRLYSLRAVINLCAMMAFFYAVAVAPLTQVTALAFTTPAFATLLAIPILGEVVGLRRWAAIFVAFGGTVLIIRPGFESLGAGGALALAAALGWAAVVLIMRSLGRTESAVTITAYMSLLMTPLALVPALFVWTWPTLEQLGWLVFIGIVGNVGQLCLSQALKEADTHVVMPMDFFRLIWIAAIAYVAFNEVPDLPTWIGGIVIFASGAYITHRERAYGQQKLTVGQG
jgi:drug/metabolite transporter (DMT)-like permease